MNKGQWIISAFVAGALATAVAYIAIQWNAMPPEGQASADDRANPNGPMAGQASPPLSEQAAQTIAVQTLMGDPYGRTSAEVLKNMTAKGLELNAGQSEWVWEVRIAPSADMPQGINGELRINANDGRLTPVMLPFLD